MQKNIKIVSTKSRLPTIIVIFVIVSLVVPSTSIIADHGQLPQIHGWYQSIGSNSTINKGFDNNHNIATRGMTIYNNELYVGTQNHCLSTMFNDLSSQTVPSPQQNNLQSLQMKNQGSTIGSTQMKKVSTNSMLQIIQQPMNNGQQIAQQLQHSEVAPDGGGGSYDPHYLYSPDGGAHTYYLEPEVFGLNGVPDALLQLAGTLGTSIIRALLHFGSGYSDGCEIWKYSNTTGAWTQIVGGNSITGMGSGFNYNHNFAVGVMKEFSFDHKLYVGTWDTPGLGPILDQLRHITRKGCEIWRYDGTTWEQVVGSDAYNITGRSSNNGGFGNPDNMGACSIEEFNGYLYVGTMNFNFTQTGACEIWRTNDGDHWTKVVDHGFRSNMTQTDLDNGVTNTYTWEMRNYSGSLYAGTFNSHRVLGPGVGGGCQLWKTSDGVTWNKVTLPNGNDGNGFGEWQNYGIRRMGVYNGLLYFGTATDILISDDTREQACEVWSYDGTNGPNAWHNLIGEEASNEHPGNNLYKDGFGNNLSKYAWGMAVAANGIWIGASKDGGCQIFRYNGTGWFVSVRTGDGEKPDGFGDTRNTAARSMIEYPRGSGTIVAGTFTQIFIMNGFLHFEPEVGCEVWIRHL